MKGTSTNAGTKDRAAQGGAATGLRHTTGHHLPPPLACKHERSASPTTLPHQTRAGRVTSRTLDDDDDDDK